jgi:hypothetical protein
VTARAERVGPLSDKAVRNLSHLEDSASTARVLNLLRVYRRRQNDPAYTEAPFFKNVTLNRSLILKHRLRRDERELFLDGRQIATKIIVPIDGQDLRLGGRSVFVDQFNYDNIMESVFGDTWLSDTADREMMAIVDGLPSLDPFLLREQLRRHDRHPARCYFEISDADMNRMIRFVEHEIQKLIDLCFSGGEAQTAADRGHGSRLVQKILSNTVDAETEPLRLTLRLEKREYQEGVFCWKGFLYYKWTLAETLPNVSRVADAITKAKPRGSLDVETQAYLQKARESLRGQILKTLETARKSLRFYDAAFASLIDGKPTAFRDFLLNAPAMFCELGERLGAVSHIVSFWNFRFPQGRLPVVTGAELMDIFTDFESSLSFPEVTQATRKAG